MFAVQQATSGLDALEGIVGSILLVETEVVLVGLFVLELHDVSFDDDTDVQLEEKSNNVGDDETDFSAGAKHCTARNLIEVLVETLNQRALGKHEVEREPSQAEREEEAEPDEEGVGFDHAAVSNHRPNESKERDERDNRENDTGDDETNPSTRRDFDLGVVQEVRSCVDSMDEPEENTSADAATDEGEERCDENGGPDWNAATEVSAVAHRGCC